MKKLKFQGVQRPVFYLSLSLHLSSPGSFGCSNHAPLVTFAVRMGVKEQVALQTQLQDTSGTMRVNVQPTDATGLCKCEHRQQMRNEVKSQCFLEEFFFLKQQTLLGLLYLISFVTGSGWMPVIEVIAGITKGRTVTGRANN